MSNRRVPLVYLTDKLLKAKLLTSKPVWYEPLCKHPPLAEYTPQKDPAQIVFPEDAYIKEVYKRYPKLVYEAYDPNTFDVYPAKKLALRIMELIDMGIPKQRATEIADAEFWNVRRQENEEYDIARYQARHDGRDPEDVPPPRRMIRRVQLQEEYHIKQGLIKLKLQKEAAEAAKARPVADMEDNDDDDDDDD